MSRMIAFALFVSATGCMLPASSAPKSGVVATGEQLAVVDDVKVWTTTQKEKVAETEYKDADGNVVGTGAVYQDKTQVHTMKIWYPVQGVQQLADEDFFNIADDKPALDQTLAMREDGKKWNHRGIGIMVGGVVTAIVGYAIGNSTASPILELTGSLALTAGYGAAWYGAREMNPETHAVDRSIAERDALKYNQNLGHTVGINVVQKNF
jgi:hypothetical protein